MSIDVFVVYFKDSEPEKVSTQLVRQQFEPYLTEDSNGAWVVNYDNIQDAVIFAEREEELHSFSINRPCQDKRLWESIYHCLALGNGMFVLPGADYPLVRSQETIKHIPEEMFETLGQPKVVGSFEEFEREMPI